MALRLLLVAVAVLELLAPKRLVDFWMNVATVDDDVALRPWVYTVARLEGLVILLWALRRGRRGRPA